MKTLSLTFSLWILILSSCQKPAIEGTFDNYYRDSSADEIPCDILVNEDGSYAICGYSTPIPTTEKTTAFLYHIDTRGELIGKAFYHFEENNYARAIVSTSDGGYLIAGESSGKLLIMKSSPNLVEEWKIIKAGIDSTCSAIAIIPMNEHEYVVGYSSGNQVIMLRIDDVGNQISDRKIFISPGEIVSKMIKTMDNEIVIVGSSIEKGFIAKYTEQNVLAWQDYYVNPLIVFPLFKFNDVIETNEKNLIVVGEDTKISFIPYEVNSCYLMVEYTSQGAIVSDSLWGTGNCEWTGLTFSQEGDITLIGRSKDGNNPLAISKRKLSDKTEIWSRNFAPATEGVLALCPDGGYVIATNSSNPNNQDLRVIKTDLAGRN